MSSIAHEIKSTGGGDGFDEVGVVEVSVWWRWHLPTRDDPTKNPFHVPYSPLRRGHALFFFEWGLLQVMPGELLARLGRRIARLIRLKPGEKTGRTIFSVYM